ncbi:MAG: hypothetical protein KME60_23710 [Cyanomargarita calcarea GSE-NOS-MK-12-04C]|jgi:hypothetical protein|uniref:Uncharacterized protein n=1 Tax=Cyanomargarita calcarea GSE-NOS-MK-12-04C TaxID=2839659 RepID=A0A951QQY8_9CYAN|nr:hypothetical protein [Cyanomargarita calcarea GSE-NOS-MK-12-04C]
MAKAILNQILVQLKSLEMVELQQLNQAVQDCLNSQITSEQAAFHQALLESGLVKQIKMPSLRKPTERRLVEIQGQPIE